MEKKFSVESGMEYGMEIFQHGMEEIRQYGMWKNHLPFHNMPWQFVMCHIAYLVNATLVLF